MPTIEDAIRAWQEKDYAAARGVCLTLGDANALYLLGMMYANGEGVPADPAEAGRLWERSAADGHPGAMQALGRLCAAGQGGYTADPGRAAHWFFRAWQAGQDDAEQDIIRTRAALEAAAEGGSAVAQNTLGLLYCFGHDDPAQAAAWFERAADQDEPEALRMLGYLLAEGKGVAKDEARAAELYRRAAEGGDRFAQLNYAGMLDQAAGGLTRDVSAAITWFRRAAEQGLAEANHRLAELLAERSRDRRDAAEAVRRLTRVAAAGPPDAEYRLDAGDGSWTVVMKDQGRMAALHPLQLDELVGLPDGD